MWDALRKSGGNHVGARELKRGYGRKGNSQVVAGIDIVARYEMD